MTLLAGTLAVLAFMSTVEGLGVYGIAREAIRESRSAWGILRDPTLDDHKREQRLQAGSLSLLRLFLHLCGATVGALATALAPLVVFHLVGLVELSAVAHWLATSMGILFSSFVAALWILARRLL